MKWFVILLVSYCFTTFTVSFRINPSHTTVTVTTTITTTTTNLINTAGTRAIREYSSHSMKRQVLLFINQNHHHHNTRLYSSATTRLLRSYRSSGPLPPLDVEGLIKAGEQRENERDNIPTSLEDIPHWTKRPIAKQQFKNKVAQVDNETYWKEAFATKDERYYRDYFNSFGFVARGSFTVEVPIQYPSEPTFLPRQWTPTTQTSSTSSLTTTTTTTTTSTTTTNQNHYETQLRPQLSLPMSNQSSASINDHGSEEKAINDSDTPPHNMNSKTDVKEQVESTPAEHQLRIVDVDCNLWHKDLLLLLLPKPPPESSATSISDPNNTGESTTSTDVEIPDCLKILQNDDLAPVVAMITPSSTIAEAAKGLDILKRVGNPNSNGHPIRLRTTVGVHPYHAPDPFHNYHDSNDGVDDHLAVTDVASTIEAAKRLLDDTENKDWICAIGECGLDSTTGFPPIAYQIPYFTAQIQLANEYRLPLFVHERNAHDTLIELLEEYVDPDRIPNIIIHCFTGNVLHCETYMKRGYYISISGFVFREREASQVQLCLEHDMIPLDRLMIETDSPYMGFTGCRELFIEKNLQAVNAPFLTSKQRKVYSTKQNYPNPPSSIVMVLHQILHHINVGRNNRNEALLTVQELADVTTRNANTFFGLGL